MASYIINDNGNGGYSRADFVSALEGLQPLLVSERNIKTINGSSVLGSGNIEVNVTPPTPQEYPHEALLTDTEKQYRANTLARINELNPIVNGKRKYMMFGFISDLHTMPTSAAINAVDNTEMQNDITAMLNAGILFPNWDGEGNVSDAATIASYVKSAWPSDDGSYYGASAEGAVRLLGAIAFGAGVDTVICGGDLSSGRLPYNCYSYQLYQMKKMFDKYITVPHYFTDGNHERKYDANVIRRTNTEWLKWLNLLNSSGASYINGNDTRYGDKSNTYFVDFPLHKVRLVGLSSYENSSVDVGTGYVLAPYGYNFFDALSFDNPEDATDWTVLALAHYNANDSIETLLSYYYSGERIGSATGVPWGATTRNVAGFMNPDKSTENSTPGPYDSRSKNAQYGRGYAGKAALCLFSGHVHGGAKFSVTSSGDKNLIDSLSIRNSDDSYTFSIFIIDDDNYKLHWLKFGANYSSSNVPSGFDNTANEFTLDYRHH